MMGTQAKENGQMSMLSMMDMKKLRERAMREGMKLMANPRVMKVMSDPRVMKAMMNAVSFRGRAKAVVDARFAGIAKKFNLATGEDIRALKQTLQSIESSLGTLQSKVESNGSSRQKGAHA